MTEQRLQFPAPYFGGKSRIASMVWERFGDTANFVDPFCGSCSILLARPQWDVSRGAWKDDMTRIETINDADGFVDNVFRALAAAPDEVARWADLPVSECSQHAVHVWLVNQREGLTARLEGDPDYYDAKIAGRWLWGISVWIGSGWCSGDGPWHSVDGKLINPGSDGQGIQRKRVHLGDAGRGVHRQRVSLTEWFAALSARLRRVRVCCGDWTRVLGPTPTTTLGMTAIFLDPPYAQAERTENLYAHDTEVSVGVRRWAIAHGDDPLLRIALCDYGEAANEMPETWTAVHWKAHGGYGAQGEGRGRENAGREVVWFSPNCLQPAAIQRSLFDLLGEGEGEAV